MATPNSSEDSLQCAKLLELVKTVSELQNSGALQNLDDSDSYLTQLERTASGIRDILTHLQTSQKQQSVAAIPVNPALIGSNSSSAQLPATQQPQQLNEIYQNLGPLMGSGLRSSPALPPRQHENPPPLPPRVPRRPPSSQGGAGSRLTPISSSLTSLSTSSTSLSYYQPKHPIRPDATPEEKLQNLTAEREQLIQLLSDEARFREKQYSELEVISQKIRSIPLPSTESVSFDILQNLGRIRTC
jgi:hypothetical protein